VRVKRGLFAESVNTYDLIGRGSGSVVKKTAQKYAYR